MYTHTPVVPQQMSRHSQHQSTERIRVPRGPFGLAEQGLLFEHFFLFQNFRQGGNAWNLFDFDHQSAAIFCVDTIKYYSIPSVPSRLEGVKTRLHLCCIAHKNNPFFWPIHQPYNQHQRLEAPLRPFFRARCTYFVLLLNMD